MRGDKEKERKERERKRENYMFKREIGLLHMEKMPRYYFF